MGVLNTIAGWNAGSLPCAIPVCNARRSATWRFIWSGTRGRAEYPQILRIIRLQIQANELTHCRWGNRPLLSWTSLATVEVQRPDEPTAIIYSAEQKEVPGHGAIVKAFMRQ